MCCVTVTVVPSPNRFFLVPVRVQVPDLIPFFVRFLFVNSCCEPGTRVPGTCSLYPKLPSLGRSTTAPHGDTGLRNTKHGSLSTVPIPAVSGPRGAYSSRCPGDDRSRAVGEGGWKERRGETIRPVAFRSLALPSCLPALRCCRGSPSGARALGHQLLSVQILVTRREGSSSPPPAGRSPQGPTATTAPLPLAWLPPPARAPTRSGRRPPRCCLPLWCGTPTPRRPRGPRELGRLRPRKTSAGQPGCSSVSPLPVPESHSLLPPDPQYRLSTLFHPSLRSCFFPLYLLQWDPNIAFLRW